MTREPNGIVVETTTGKSYGWLDQENGKMVGRFNASRILEVYKTGKNLVTGEQTAQLIAQFPAENVVICSMAHIEDQDPALGTVGNVRAN